MGNPVQLSNGRRAAGVVTTVRSTPESGKSLASHWYLHLPKEQCPREFGGTERRNSFDQRMAASLPVMVVAPDTSR